MAETNTNPRETVHQDSDEHESCCLLFTPEQLQDMKKAGLNKPEGVPWAVWQAPMQLSTRHNVIIDKAALGLSAKSIADELSMTPEHIRKLLRSPIIRNEVDKRRQQGFTELVQAKLAELSGLALLRFESVLSDPNTRPSAVLEAARFVLEHQIGKAKQKIEHSGALHFDFRKQAAELEARYRTLESQGLLQPAPMDAAAQTIENFLESQTNGSFVVGKRGENGNAPDLDLSGSESP